MPRQKPHEDGQALRLNRILSLAGLTSRRKADEWISAGRVTINGRLVAGPGARAVWGRDRIRVDGQEIPPPSQRHYLMLNKPFGYISSLNDPRGRPLVMDLLKHVHQRLYPVGRLDFDTMGLLLFTDDGEWAYRLTHPRYRIPRTYKITASGEITNQAMEQLRRGVHLEDGHSGQSKVTLITRHRGRSIIRLALTHGRPRQVRRMLQAVGHPVIHLIRIGFGDLVLGDLKVGEYRWLETYEVAAMKKSVGLL